MQQLDLVSIVTIIILQIWAGQGYLIPCVPEVNLSSLVTSTATNCSVQADEGQYSDASEGFSVPALPSTLDWGNLWEASGQQPLLRVRLRHPNSGPSSDTQYKFKDLEVTAGGDGLVVYACPFGVLDPDSCDVNHIPEVRVATCPLCLLDRTNLGAVSGRITASAGDPGAIYNFSTSLFCADATAKVPRGEIPAILSPAGPDLCTGGKVWFSQFEGKAPTFTTGGCAKAPQDCSPFTAWPPAVDGCCGAKGERPGSLTSCMPWDDPTAVGRCFDCHESCKPASSPAPGVQVTSAPRPRSLALAATFGAVVSLSMGTPRGGRDDQGEEGRVAREGGEAEEEEEGSEEESQGVPLEGLRAIWRSTGEDTRGTISGL